MGRVDISVRVPRYLCPGPGGGVQVDTLPNEPCLGPFQVEAHKSVRSALADMSREVALCWLGVGTVCNRRLRRCGSSVTSGLGPLLGGPLPYMHACMHALSVN